MINNSRELATKTAITLMLLCLVSYAHAAAKPITGVSCGDGFYIRTPDGHLHWVLYEEGAVQEVYDGSLSLYAMTECGTGVVSVFRSDSTYEAFYSPDCLNVGRAEGLSSKVYEGSEPIEGFSQRGSGVVTTLRNGDLWYSASCKNLAEPPSVRVKKSQ